MLTIYTIPNKKVSYCRPDGKKITKLLNSDCFKVFLSGNTASYWIDYCGIEKRKKFDSRYDLNLLISHAPHLITGLYYGSPGEADLFYIINEDCRTIDDSMVENVKMACEEFSLSNMIWEFLRNHIGEKVICVYH